MERARFIEHEGRKVVFLDFSGVPEEEEALREVAKARAFFDRMPRERTVLTLTDVNGSIHSLPVIESIKAMIEANRPIMLASAVTGLNTLQKLVVRLVSFGTGRKLGVFRTREEALAWLVQQKVPPRTVPEEFSPGPDDPPERA